MSKTECLLTGPWKNVLQEIENVKVNKTCIQTLGIFIGQNKGKKWTKWKTKKLTIFGRVCVLNIWQYQNSYTLGQF